jgi:O-antigen ligase
LVVIGVLGVTAAALPFTEKIADRITRDWDKSVDFRVQENNVALRVASERPLIGVGPNNYREYLLKFDPRWQWTLQFEGMSVNTLHIRPLAAPHNAFLLLAAETGILGLGTFLIFFLGMMGYGVRAVRWTTGNYRVVSYGLALGLIGLLLQQLYDFSIWVDPLMYTFALMAGLLNLAPMAQQGETGSAA